MKFKSILGAPWCAFLLLMLLIQLASSQSSEDGAPSTNEANNDDGNGQQEDTRKPTDIRFRLTPPEDRVDILHRSGRQSVWAEGGQRRRGGGGGGGYRPALSRGECQSDRQCRRGMVCRFIGRSLLRRCQSPYSVGALYG